MRNRLYHVYIMTNVGNSVLYTGVTNNLERRIYEHKHKLVGGFTKMYKATKLVYYESTEDIVSALAREKQIKGGSRLDKLRLIESINRKWEDLADKL